MEDFLYQETTDLISGDYIQEDRPYITRPCGEPPISGDHVEDRLHQGCCCVRMIQGGRGVVVSG